MNKQDLIKEYAEKKDITKVEAGRDVDALIEIMKQGIINDGELKFPGFMSIKKKHREAREARNPRTGEKMQTEAKYVPKAEFSSVFKDEIKKESVS